MEKARSAVTNFFGRVPLTYTRFSLTPQVDGDASQVEMKLADDDECGESTLGDHVVKHREGHNQCKSLCFKILGVVLLFFIGFLIGYLSHRGRVASQLSSNNVIIQQEYTQEDEAGEIVGSDTPNMLYWSDLKPMLDKKVELLQFEESITNLCSSTREAGSENEVSSATMVYNEFQAMQLDKVWNDEHFVTLQDRGSSNKVELLKSQDTEETFTSMSYVAYSASKSVTASLVYCHYGRTEDFDALRAKNIDVSGKIVLVRSGNITFSEKVRNAEIAKAVGVLIYPDPSDFTFPTSGDQEIEAPFGHAHFGTGDPFTPGFPSFNHTQFPPSKSSGLPQIPVQSLSSKDGTTLIGKLDGPQGCPDGWKGCKLADPYKIKLEVNNIMANKKILNVFGVIKGFDEPDRYVVVGAQRDSWGKGAANAGVGTSVLLKLAQMIKQMVKEGGYRPRRSIVFASWSAGDFGAVGATEWLEGYLSTLHLKTIAYISLDAAVQGRGSLQVSGSPLMYSIIQKTLTEVSDPVSNNDDRLWTKVQSEDFLRPLSISDPAYPFLAYSGVPSVSFSFIKDKKPYAYLGTAQDTFDNLKKLVNVDSMCRAVANLAGQVILRMTHDHKLPLDFERYKNELRKVPIQLVGEWQSLKQLDLTVQWMNSAWGDFSRAVETVKNNFAGSDLEIRPVLRSLNDRVMKVEHSMLSPYVSPLDTPFRHILYGYGNHTVSALIKHIRLQKTNKELFDKDLFKNQLALLTWTVQGAANALAGEIWEINNEF
ncbi:transferrin receptor protein 1 [Hyperolius riggenbachi]|uniref:transferrin receptor protein 1 n=1 Tax=Hyperolius riggenbachi TaxID=752182 RepID=UPI0035A3BF23